MDINQRETLKNVAYAAKLLRLQDERSKQTGPGGLMNFVRYFWGVLEPGNPFVDGWAMQAIAEHLEAVTFGELNRLLINVPPGFSKSLLSNTWWPAWEWGPMDRAHLRGLSFSYAAHLTERDNDRLRTLITSKPYQELWGDRFKLTGDAKIKIANDKMGWQLASSVGGVTTGERADRVRCLEGSTLILTDKGLISIEEIVNKKLDVKIAGFDHETNQIQWQDILEYEKSERSDFVELQWDGGILICTPEHPIFVIRRGYVKADEVRTEDRVYWTWRGSRAMPKLRQRDAIQAEQKETVLQQGLSISAYEKAKHQELHNLWKGSVQVPSAMGAQQVRFAILQRQMHENMACRGEQSILEGARQNNLQMVRRRIWGSPISSASSDQGILLSVLQVQSSMGVREDAGFFTSSKTMPMVRKNISAKSELAKILLKKMYRRGSMWGKFSKLCSWVNTISARMEQDICSKDKGARRKRLSSLRGRKRRASGSSCSPYRLQQEKFKKRELNYTLQDLPWKNSRISDENGMVGVLEEKIISSVKKYSGDRSPVYNLRVAPYHNYFAGGILTHNCDDPHAVQKGESERVRSETVRWFKESMSNRLNHMEKSSIVVIMQRVHELDVSGAIIEDPQGMGYEHLCIPMRYETDGPWSQSTKIGWHDPRKIDGELAWPERFSADVVDALERDLGPWAFSAQYSQSPSPRGGGIIKRNWFRLWENPQNKFPPFDNVVAAVDPAYTEKDENDPSAMAIFATFRHPETNEFGIMLVHCWRKRLPIHGDTSPRFPGESIKAYERRCGDGWGLVEWIWHCCDAYGVQQLFIEGKASGLSVLQEIERRQVFRPWACDIDTGKGGGDKVSRLTAVQPLFSQGLIWAPDRDWADMFIGELCNFPKGRFDDLVDCASSALKKMREMGLIQHTDEREYEEYFEKNQPRATQPLYPV